MDDFNFQAHLAHKFGHPLVIMRENKHSASLYIKENWTVEVWVPQDTCFLIDTYECEWDDDKKELSFCGYPFEWVLDQVLPLMAGDR